MASLVLEENYLNWIQQFVKIREGPNSLNNFLDMVFEIR